MSKKFNEFNTKLENSKQNINYFRRSKTIRNANGHKIQIKSKQK